MMSCVELLCPACTHPLPAHADVTVACGGCGRSYPVVDGVLRLVGSAPRSEDARTADAFAWHGSRFDELRPEHEEHFLNVIAPIGKQFFRDKVVLDAGCGPGRHALYAARYGAREVWALDLGQSVAVARRLTSGQPNVHVVQADILSPPFSGGKGANGFDFVFSIGVIHHLSEPQVAIASLARLLRPGGQLFVWVYAREGSTVMRVVIESLRALSTRLPRSVLPLIAWPLAALLHTVVRIVYRPLSTTALAQHLPAAGYLAPLSEFSFRRNYSVVTDQLVAPKTDYINGGQLTAWFAAAGLESIKVTPRNGNSWRAWGVRQSA
jgi:SAM-dependent methyltransferase